jgi:hypothetical protein
MTARQVQVYVIGRGVKQSGAATWPRISGAARSAVIASEAKQSILSLRCTMDCFAALAMTIL